MDASGADQARLNHSLMKAVAEQVLGGSEVVVVEGRAFRVSRTGKGTFRTVRFLMGGREYQAIEQNPEKPSRWGKLAREGHRVVQFARSAITEVCRSGGGWGGARISSTQYLVPTPLTAKVAENGRKGREGTGKSSGQAEPEVAED